MAPVMTLNGQWIELFRAGNYGDKGSYGIADIEKMIANFNPAEHEPPIVMGHPEMDAPAYGWIDALRRSGDTLLGRPKQVPPQFEELVRQGRFKKRSVSFYRTANGPVLRHVGFLGAMPPEVKGLADVKFSAGAFDSIDFKEEVNMDAEQIGKSVSQQLKEFFTELFKGKKVVDLNDADQGKALEAALASALKPLQDQHTKLVQEFADYKKETEKNAATAATQTQAQFADAQMARVKTANRWLPAFDKMGLPQLFTELSKVATKVSFGEGDKKVEKPAAEAFADFMISLGEIVPSGELSGGEQGTKGKLVRFNEPKDGNLVIDQDSVALAEAATVLAAKEKIPYGQALNQLRASGEWKPSGAAASGQV